MQDGERCVCLGLRKAARAITQLYNEAFRTTGCRVTQANILAVIMSCEPVSVTRLAEELVMDRTTLTRNLALLERNGFVSISNGLDRRERKIATTEQGREVMQAVEKRWLDIQQDLRSTLGDDRLVRLFSDLDAVVDASRAHPHSA